MDYSNIRKAISTQDDTMDKNSKSENFKFNIDFLDTFNRIFHPGTVWNQS